MGCDLTFFLPICFLAQLFAQRLGRLSQLAQRLRFEGIPAAMKK
jgi:hypothetical protein